MQFLFERRDLSPKPRTDVSSRFVSAEMVALYGLEQQRSGWQLLLTQLLRSFFLVEHSARFVSKHQAKWLDKD
jgi:hypothetical protein